mmetsp:Transcript_19433/g.56443  ORF Transcript_19433/g.56443 Transcript_19433/m.56443 type:complete len:208 (+) Transcript_19433:338-961(+)
MHHLADQAAARGAAASAGQWAVHAGHRAPRGHGHRASAPNDNGTAGRGRHVGGRWPHGVRERWSPHVELRLVLARARRGHRRQRRVRPRRRGGQALREVPLQHRRRRRACRLRPPAVARAERPPRRHWSRGGDRCARGDGGGCAGPHNVADRRNAGGPFCQHLLQFLAVADGIHDLVGGRLEVVVVAGAQALLYGVGVVGSHPGGAC